MFSATIPHAPLPVKAEVTSSNTVGYTKLNLTAGLNLVGVQFVNVGAQDAAVSSVANLTGQATYDEDMNAQTELRTWTGNGYATYEWTGALSTDNPDMAAGLEDDMGLTDATKGAYDNQWFFGYEPTDVALTPGTGVWIKASDAAQNGVTFTGEVPSGTTVQLDLVPGLNLLCFPWPMNASLSCITLTGQATYDEEMYAQTELRIWTGNGYATYEWTGSLSTENPDMAAGLEDEMGLVDATKGAYDNQWFFAYEPTDYAVPAGVGFWIKASGSGKITFTRP